MTDTHPAHQGTLSVQLYSFRDAAQADPGGTLARVASLGFRYVEPFGLGSSSRPTEERLQSARALRRGLDDHGLNLSSVHAAAPLGPQAESILNELETVGARLAVVSWPGEVSGFGRDALDTLESAERFAAAMNEAARNAAGRGIRLGYHNHWWEWHELAGRSGYDALLERLDPQVFVEVDTYWAQTAGQDPAGLLRGLGERTLLLHLKDGPAVPDAPQVPLGGGGVDYRACILAAPSATWHVLEMDSSAGDVFRDIGESAERLVGEGLSVWEQ